MTNPIRYNRSIYKSQKTNHKFEIPNSPADCSRGTGRRVPHTDPSTHYLQLTTYNIHSILPVFNRGRNLPSLDLLKIICPLSMPLRISLCTSAGNASTSLHSTLQHLFIASLHESHWMNSK